MPAQARSLIAAVAICAAAAPAPAGAAAAAPPRGALSRAEYARLSAATAAFERIASARSVDWAAAMSACRGIGQGTALLASQRTSCLASTTTLHALASFPHEQAACATAGTTVTTTTATSEPAAIAAVACLRPRYLALARDAGALSVAAVAARRQAVSRGLRGACLATLTPTPSDLGEDRRFAQATSRLAADVSLLIAVSNGQVSSTEVNQSTVDANVGRFERAARSVLDQHEPQRLAACPHS